MEASNTASPRNSSRSLSNSLLDDFNPFTSAEELWRRASLYTDKRLDRTPVMRNSWSERTLLGPNRRENLNGLILESLENHGSIMASKTECVAQCGLNVAALRLVQS